MLNIFNRKFNNKIIITLILSLMLISLNTNYTFSTEETKPKSTVIINNTIVKNRVEFYVPNFVEHIKKHFKTFMTLDEQNVFEENEILYLSSFSEANYINMKNIIKKYTGDDADLVLSYMLHDKYQKIYARYIVNKDGTYVNYPITGLTYSDENFNEEEVVKYNDYMKRILRFYPIEIFDKIKFVILQSDGKGEHIASASIMDIDSESYILKIDINDMLPSGRFRKRMKEMYLEMMLNQKGQLVREDEIPSINLNKVYTFNGKMFHENSFVGLFYKNFWINEEIRRKNFNILYPNSEDNKAIIENSDDINALDDYNLDYEDTNENLERSILTDKNLEKNEGNSNKINLVKENIGPNDNKNNKKDETDETEEVVKYKQSTTDFINKRSKTGVLEDFEESYNAFLDNKKPGYNYLKDRKALFFYNFEDFRNIRRTAGRDN